MHKLPRLPWQRSAGDRPYDYRADLPFEEVAWARLYRSVSGELPWVWSVSVGAFNSFGRCLSKQESADQATEAAWALKRRNDLAQSIPRNQPFEIDFDGPTETLEDYLFIIRFWYGERLSGGTAPPHIAEMETKLRRVLRERTGRPH